jgi:hypothetical protein
MPQQGNIACFWLGSSSPLPLRRAVYSLPFPPSLLFSSHHPSWSARQEGNRAEEGVHRHTHQHRTRRTSKRGRPAPSLAMWDLNDSPAAPPSPSADDSGASFSSAAALVDIPDDDSAAAAVVTRQFFVLAPAAAIGAAPGPGSSNARAGWLRRAAAPAGGPATVQAAAGKKSRRGPRSRSSQYRGVTFYRRTGRWESHIW